jgi:hypothetical protein
VEDLQILGDFPQRHGARVKEACLMDTAYIVYIIPDEPVEELRFLGHLPQQHGARVKAACSMDIARQVQLNIPDEPVEALQFPRSRVHHACDPKMPTRSASANCPHSRDVNTRKLARVRTQQAQRCSR